MIVAADRRSQQRVAREPPDNDAVRHARPKRVKSSMDRRALGRGTIAGIDSVFVRNGFRCFSGQQKRNSSF